MLQNPTEQQLKILTSFRYEKNKATVHTDTSLMPSKKWLGQVGIIFLEKSIMK